MLAVSDDNCLTLEDIPDPGFFQIGKENDLNNLTEGPVDNEIIINDLNNEELFMLKKIKEARAEGKLVGRKTLADRLEGSEYELTEYQVRNRLGNLEAKGYLERKRGRHGTVLSKKARKLLD
jgi:hypothetical protein